MKTQLIIILTIVLVANSLPAQSRFEAFFEGTTPKKETIEWTCGLSLVFLNKIYLADAKPWTTHPLLKTKFKPGLQKESISQKAIFGVGGIFGAVILFAPNDKGRLNSTSYQHFKGFVESSLIYTPIITSIAKLSFGKKRPYYMEEIYRNDDDARKSFWSGHSSSSFSIVTYFNLYLYSHLGENSKKNLTWKIPLSVLLYSTAVYVAQSRLKEHQHDLTDVTVGGLVGTGVSMTIFTIHENWLKKMK